MNSKNLIILFTGAGILTLGSLLVANVLSIEQVLGSIAIIVGSLLFLQQVVLITKYQSDLTNYLVILISLIMTIVGTLLLIPSVGLTFELFLEIVAILAGSAIVLNSIYRIVNSK